MKRAPKVFQMGKEKEKLSSHSQTLLSSSSSSSSIINNNNNINIIPTWLLTHIADLEERMKVLAMGLGEDEDTGDTFAERAESYYQKRPQLLTLLQDLYNGYITLSDRYIQTLAKYKHHHHHRRHSSQFSTIDDDGVYTDQEEETSGITTTTHIDSDIESSLSYQLPQPHLPPSPMMLLLNAPNMLDIDSIVAELVMKNVEHDLLTHEVSVMERKYGESSRKIELQKSLLEVLESERLVLLNENASLGFRVKSLVEENKGLASESMFVKRKAGELAKCVVKMREDHRVFMLHRKIEDLQAQINGLEKRNKEYYEQLLRRDSNSSSSNGQYENNSNNVSGSFDRKGRHVDGIALEVRLHMQRLSRRFKWKDDFAEKNSEVKRRTSLWKRMKNMDLFLCGMNPTCS